MIEALVVVSVGSLVWYLWSREPEPIPAEIRCRAHKTLGDSIYSSAYAARTRCVLHIGHDGLHEFSE